MLLISLITIRLSSKSLRNLTHLTNIPNLFYFPLLLYHICFFHFFSQFWYFCIFSNYKYGWKMFHIFLKILHIFFLPVFLKIFFRINLTPFRWKTWFCVNFDFFFKTIFHKAKNHFCFEDIILISSILLICLNEYLVCGNWFYSLNFI